MRQAGMPAWLACSKVYKSDDTPSRSRRAAQSAFVSLCFESKQTLILMTLERSRTVPNRTTAPEAPDRSSGDPAGAAEFSEIKSE